MKIWISILLTIFWSTSLSLAFSIPSDDILIAGFEGKGHVNVDSIQQGNEKKEVEMTKELVVATRYINLPVKNGAPKRLMRFLIDGKPVREFEIELALGEPDFWVFAHVKEFQGKQMTIRIEGKGGDEKLLDSITQGDTIRGAENLYKERYRPQFHFSSRRGWNNDPNGLVYYKGEYHLFYQHNPYGWNWGNMHWGHAVSRDLVHWKELPIALYPHRFGDWCYSGSAALDWKNTAGFKEGDEDVLIAAYTSTGRGESIAYSTDQGRTFTDYEGNPVVRHSGRDPKIVWHEPTEHWVMAVYDQSDEKRCIAFYTSKDLKEWEFQSRIEDFYECPEIFQLPVDGNEKDKKWVVYAADGNYAIGQFDGKTFTMESGKHRGNYGNCFYASQTFSDVPVEDGRRIQIGWARIKMPGMPFNQMMTFPVELGLRTTEEGIRMFAEPVREIETIHGEKHSWQDETLNPEENLLSGIHGRLFHIRAELEGGSAGGFGFEIRGVPVEYDTLGGQLTCQGCSAPLKPEEGKIFLEILVDRTSIEIFGNRGRIYMPVGVLLPEEESSLKIFTRGGVTKVDLLEVYELNSAWE